VQPGFYRRLASNCWRAYSLLLPGYRVLVLLIATWKGSVPVYGLCSSLMAQRSLASAGKRRTGHGQNTHAAARAAHRRASLLPADTITAGSSLFSGAVNGVARRACLAACSLLCRSTCGFTGLARDMTPLVTMLCGDTITFFGRVPSTTPRTTDRPSARRQAALCLLALYPRRRQRLRYRRRAKRHFTACRRRAVAQTNAGHLNLPWHTLRRLHRSAPVLGCFIGATLTRLLCTGRAAIP
jgi:hypothetical protein